MLIDTSVKYSVVLFDAVGFIGEDVQEMIKLLGGGETYDKVVVADDYNAAPVSG